MLIGISVANLPRGLIHADSLTDGEVSRQLRTWAAAGVSNPAIARMLTTNFGLNVTRETVRRWVQALEEAAA